MAKKHSKNGSILYPIPKDRTCLVSFPHPEDEGITPVKSVRPGKASKDAVPATVVKKLELKLLKSEDDAKAKKKTARISVGTLNRTFAPGSYVSVEILRHAGLVDWRTNCLRITAHGKLDRPLIIVADAFSARAERMVIMTGGRPVRLV